VATDHAPHTVVDKDVEFGLAANGISGIETALGLLLEAVAAGRLTLARAIGALTVGPAGPVADAAASWSEAADAHAARARGALAPEGLLRSDEHLADLILATSSGLLARLATRTLAPLDAETDASRTRLSATLAVWLAEMGAVSPTAAALDVHPQTVRYRVTRLRELFGTSLDDPEARFELQLALRASPPGV
jgi:DNA-binding PucR family transcriptional regulator